VVVGVKKDQQVITKFNKISKFVLFATQQPSYTAAARSAQLNDAQKIDISTINDPN
jgi:hypothetical protein